MTDLQQLLAMLLKSNESFNKELRGNDWCVNITGRDIEFYFSHEGEFKFCYNSKKCPPNR